MAEDPLEDPKVRVAMRECLRLRASDHASIEAVEKADRALQRALAGRAIHMVEVTHG